MNARDAIHSYLDAITPAVKRSPCRCAAKSYPHQESVACEKHAAQVERAREYGRGYDRDRDIEAQRSRG